VAPSGVERFRQATTGWELDIREMSSSTHTAKEAAEAVGVEVGAIVKSLVFDSAGEPILVLVSGPNRVSVEELSTRLGRDLGKADASFVKTHTGWSIGGVPPIGHPSPLMTVMDEDLFQQAELWAAAGSADAVFQISPERLRELSLAVVMQVT